jgi:tRNA(Ile2)-agmatinylcytidine synthase
MAVIIDELCKKFNAKVVGLPKLVRLNPACPFKTRGNAALAAEFRVEDEAVDMIKKEVIRIVDDLAELEDAETEPGIAFYSGGRIPDEVANFSDRAVRMMVELEEALALAKKYGIEIFGFKGKRGIIGAIAAMGNTFPHGYTYELIAYRVPKFWGKARLVDHDSVVRMDRATKGCTFDNLDLESGEIKITPHTPCPVLFGIRAVNLDCLKRAMRMIKIWEPMERYIIYKTNQATDAHIVVADLSKVKPYMSVAAKGTVISKPYTIKGGHTFIDITDGEASFRLAAYEPTKSFRRVVRSLIPGDEVIAYGSYKPKEGEPPTINLEKLRILRLAEKVVLRNPACPVCGKRMKSEGREKGFGCPSCGHRTKTLSKVKVTLPRSIKKGMYEVPPRARRHLAKPTFLA